MSMNRKVCAKSQGALIQDLRWINRSEQRAPCLRHLMPAASKHAAGTADGVTPAIPVPNFSATRVRQLEGALGEASEKIVQLEVEKVRLLAEVGAFKARAEQQARLHEVMHVEKAHLEVQLEEKKVARGGLLGKGLQDIVLASAESLLGCR